VIPGTSLVARTNKDVHVRSIRLGGEVTEMAEKKITPKAPGDAKATAEKAATRVTKERSMKKKALKKKAMRRSAK
jgi:hypothetical protein